VGTFGLIFETDPPSWPENDAGFDRASQLPASIMRRDFDFEEIKIEGSSPIGGTDVVRPGSDHSDFLL
jgi:hypothetical protein